MMYLPVLSTKLPHPDDPPQNLVHGLVTGVTKCGRHVTEGVKESAHVTKEYYNREGAFGLGKGILYSGGHVAQSVFEGSMELVLEVLEGVRNTPTWLAEGLTEESDGNPELDEDGLIIRHTGRVLESSLKGPRAPHLVAGLELGLAAAVADVTRGTIDLVVKPMQAKDKMHGAAEGLMYFAASPVAGTLDIAEGIVEGLWNTPEFVRDQAVQAAEQVRKATLYAGIGGRGVTWGSQAAMQRGNQMQPIVGMTLWMKQQQEQMMLGSMLPAQPPWQDIAMQQHRMRQMAAMSMAEAASRGYGPPPHAMGTMGPMCPMGTMGYGTYGMGSMSGRVMMPRQRQGLMC